LVVNPTWNEAAAIAASLRQLASQRADEVMVVDASSRDETAALAVGTDPGDRLAARP
jgi:glycosyltransferase involved in cell wall biosynthesis